MDSFRRAKHTRQIFFYYFHNHHYPEPVVKVFSGVNSGDYLTT